MSPATWFVARLGKHTASEKPRFSRLFNLRTKLLRFAQGRKTLVPSPVRPPRPTRSDFASKAPKPSETHS